MINNSIDLLNFKFNLYLKIIAFMILYLTLVPNSYHCFCIFTAPSIYAYMVNFLFISFLFWTNVVTSFLQKNDSSELANNLLKISLLVGKKRGSDCIHACLSAKSLCSQPGFFLILGILFPINSALVFLTPSQL